MKLEDLDYSYPEHLVGLSRSERSRVLWSEEKGGPSEVTWPTLLNSFSADDLLVINNTQVVPCRIFSSEGLEVTFLKRLAGNQWEVLSPLRHWPKVEKVKLPGGAMCSLIARGRPQVVEVDQELTEEYFDTHGEMALPPYILKARGEKRMRPEDLSGYQTVFAERKGSLAAPTASLHFKAKDFDYLKGRGVEVQALTLHVGLGTFLPVDAPHLKDHPMHSEWIEVPPELAAAVKRCRQRKGRVWALGTTVTRALESWALRSSPSRGFEGWTDLLIQPGFDFQVVDVLLTNFHQPRSTLLALVMAFSGRQRVQKSYKWALEHEFKLFSYGDLSVWFPEKARA